MAILNCCKSSSADPDAHSASVFEKTVDEERGANETEPETEEKPVLEEEPPQAVEEEKSVAPVEPVVEKNTNLDDEAAAEEKAMKEGYKCCGF